MHEGLRSLCIQVTTGALSLASLPNCHAQGLEDLSSPPPTSILSLPPNGVNVVVQQEFSPEERALILSAISLREHRAHVNLDYALAYIRHAREIRSAGTIANSTLAQDALDAYKAILEQKGSQTAEAHQLSIDSLREFIANSRASASQSVDIAQVRNEAVHRETIKQAESIRERQARNIQIDKQNETKSAEKIPEKKRTDQTLDESTPPQSNEGDSKSSTRVDIEKDSSSSSTIPINKPDSSSSSEDRPSLTDARRNDRLSIQRDSMKDGAEGSLIGLEHTKPEHRDDPIITTWGVGADTQSEMDGALSVSKATGYPVLVIKNDTAVDEMREIAPSLDIPPLLDSDAARAEREIALRGVGAAVGTAIDSTQVELDAALPAPFATEPATAGVERVVLRRLLDGKPVKLLAHSGGGVIDQNALLNVNTTLNSLVNAGVITSTERATMMERIDVYVVGSPADPSKWPSGIKLHLFNKEGDAIPVLGGPFRNSVPFWQLGTSQHLFQPNYLKWIADEMKAP